MVFHQFNLANLLCKLTTKERVHLRHGTWSSMAALKIGLRNYNGPKNSSMVELPQHFAVCLILWAVRYCLEDAGSYGASQDPNVLEVQTSNLFTRRYQPWETCHMSWRFPGGMTVAWQPFRCVSFAGRTHHRDLQRFRNVAASKKTDWWGSWWLWISDDCIILEFLHAFVALIQGSTIELLFVCWGRRATNTPRSFNSDGAVALFIKLYSLFTQHFAWNTRTPHKVPHIAGPVTDELVKKATTPQDGVFHNAWHLD